MNDLRDLAAELQTRSKGRVAMDVSLRRLTTYRLGGPAAVYVEPFDVDDVMTLADVLRGSSEPVPVLSLGRGSNLVISDSGWPGIVVHLSNAFARVRPLEEGEDGPQFAAGAATSMPVVANWAARRGLAGLEFGVGIPGSVGGAVRMNAGAHEMDTAGCLHSATIFDLDTGEASLRPAADLGFSYRRSNLDDTDVVLDARWLLQQAPVADVKARMERYRRHRSRTQPGAVQNAGSVFKNPPGDAAGRLVESAGLKGWRVGRASVSTLHANFFIAADGASAQDVYDLVHAVRTRVREEFGVDLEPEIRFVGDYEQPSRQATPAAAG